MAQRIEVAIFCDLEHEEDTPGEPVGFTSPSGPVDIDLCDEHRVELQAAIDALEVFARKGSRRVVEPSTKPRRSSTKRPAVSSEPTAIDSKSIRAWALANHVDVPSRGRLPQAVVERFRIETAAAV